MVITRSPSWTRQATSTTCCTRSRKRRRLPANAASRLDAAPLYGGQGGSFRLKAKTLRTRFSGNAIVARVRLVSGTDYANSPQIRFTLPALILLLTSSVTLAQESPLVGNQPVRLPTSEEMQKSQSRAREAMQRIPDSEQSMRLYGRGMPNIEAPPQAAVPAPDIATIAEKFKELGKASAPKNGQPDLLIMVSLSMPRDALERTAEQAERAGATLVFRG